MYYIVLPDSTTTSSSCCKKNEKKILWPCSLTNLTVKKKFNTGGINHVPEDFACN